MENRPKTTNLKSTMEDSKKNISRHHVLVTGGAGFIGSHLCDELVKRGEEVWCVDNLHLGTEKNIFHLKKFNNFHFLRLDLLDRIGLDQLFSEVKFDVVFHLAANSDIQQGNADHALDHKLTFMTTYEILEAMLRHKVNKIFFTSTSAVFGETGERLHEDYGPLKPISFYGANKLAAEAYISVFVDNYNFKAWILRFPNVIGERLTHGAIFDFIKRLKEDPSKLTVLGDGTQTKPYLYVKDVICAIMTVFEKAEERLAIYHVGSDDLISVRTIAETVVDEMNLKDTYIEYTGGKKGWVGDVPYFHYDIDKITSIGWKQQFTSNEALRITVTKELSIE